MDIIIVKEGLLAIYFRWMYSQHMYDFMAMECHGYPCSNCSKKNFKT